MYFPKQKVPRGVEVRLSGGSYRESYPGEVLPVTEPNHLSFVSNVFVPILKVLEPLCVMMLNHLAR